MTKLFKASILAGIFAHLWVTISWMALPLHKTTINSFKNDQAVQLTLLQNIDTAKKAVYALPEMHSKKAKSGPSAFIALIPKGQSFSWTKIATDIVNNSVTAFLIGLLLLMSGITGMGNKIKFSVIIALVAVSMSTAPMLNWWGFPLDYAAVEILDMLILSVIYGFTLAKFTEN